MSTLSWLVGAGAVVGGALWWRKRKANSLYDPGLFSQHPKERYDYIIVGAGSAGCVLANRISARNDVTVLVLESGIDDREYMESDFPGLATAFMIHDDAYFLYQPEKRKIGNVERGDQVRTGHVLGGGSTINYMAYSRGSAHDYDNWAKVTGDETWDYRHMLPYFKKTERVSDPAFVKSPYHSTKGEIGLSQQKCPSSALYRAAQAIGIPVNPDINGATNMGLHGTWANIEHGVRCSTVTALLRPALRDRVNLDVVLRARVDKVLIEGGKATGVLVNINGQDMTVKADKEVILSAGSIVSPKILMLSGVGPKHHLEELGVSVKADLPVGKNLLNHCSFELPVTTNEPVTDEVPRDPMSWSSRLEHAVWGTGPLAQGPLWCDIFTASTPQSREMGWPDVQMIFVDHFPTTMNSITAGKAINHPDDPQPLHGFTCLPTAVRSRSQGEVKLRSTDPSDLPVVTPNYLSQREDLDAIVHGIQLCQKMLDTPEMVKLGAKVRDIWTRCGLGTEHQFGSKAFWESVVKTVIGPIQHPVGTCKMGKADDPSAVVDSQLRVKGVSGLRVVDASVMPYIITANTQCPTIAIAEKAAAMINGEALLPPEDPAPT